MNELLDKLLDDLDVYSDYDKESYTSLNWQNLQNFTKRGTPEGAVLVDDKWIPKSQLKCDVDGNLYVANWFKDKL